MKGVRENVGLVDSAVFGGRERVAPVLVERMTDRERLELLLEAYDHLYDCWECYNVAPCGVGEKYYPLVGAIREYLSFTKTGAVTERVPEGSGWPPVE